MSFLDAAKAAQQSFCSRYVFGDPVEHDGVMLITVSKVMGGVGGGSGQDGGGQTGDGGGYGLVARPVGTYVVGNGEVKWRPAIDVTRLASVAAAVAIVYLCCRWRSKACRHIG